MKVKVFILLIFSVSLLSLTGLVSPYGIESPSPIGAYLNDVFPHKSPALGDWKVVDAFPGLTFVDPVALQEISPEVGFYLAEKGGKLWYVEQVGDIYEKSLALDINEKVIISGDAGLINFVLHPEFGDESSENSSYIYAYYAFHPDIEQGEVERVNKLVRFSTFPNSMVIDPASEYILIQDYDPQGYHMGGGMFFDEEGFFYLTFGDGGKTHNKLGSTQQITERFWGGIIKIDLDNREERSHAIRRNIIDYPGKPDFLPSAINQGYMIPNDNPFNDENGGVLEEFYALGLRSPHRASYDFVKKEIWIGDVGEAGREEITVIKKGGNAQWPYMEGRILGPKEKPFPLIGTENPPIFDYSRDVGNSVIGGFVYRGDKWRQSLEGLYIYGDHGSRNVWSFDPTNNKSELLVNVPEFGTGSKSGIASFASDAAGNVYILKLFGRDEDGGVVFKLEQDDSVVEEIPALLSETGAFKDLQNLEPSLGIIPYESTNPLWSDGAKKSRWIALANDGLHDTSDELITLFEKDEWLFPSGTVFIKHFSLPIDQRNPEITKKIETRFYTIDEEGKGYGLTYRWLDDESDAYLLDSGEERVIDIVNNMGVETEQTWFYPSRVQCNTCHNSNAGYVLGVNTWQLNSSLLYPNSGVSANQLETWNHLGMFGPTFTDEDIKEMPKAVSLDDPEASLQEKVVSYLAANCSYCHRPNGVEGAFDARFDTPIAEKSMINVIGKSHNNPTGGVIVEPGDHEMSQLWVRDNSIGDDKMPPIAKSMVDNKWVEILAAWIDQIDEVCDGKHITTIPYKAPPINGFGPVELDMSNGDGKFRDGQVMMINGQVFSSGLGVHAESDVQYILDRKYKQFVCYVGVDDESCDEASVRFQVFADDELLYSSPTMSKGEDARFLSVDVEGKTTLRLIALSQHDKTFCDHADWADARLLKSRDSDGDGVCDQYDRCEGANDHIDDNNDGIPDGCENIDEGGTIKYSIYPSPFVEDFTIRLVQPEYLVSKARLVITDINGRIFFEDDNVRFDTDYRLGSRLPKGIFYVSFKSGSFQNACTVVKLP